MYCFYLFYSLIKVKKWGYKATPFWALWLGLPKWETTKQCDGGKGKDGGGERISISSTPAILSHSVV